MPVSSETSISGPYTPNGETTSFAFDFKAASASEVVATDGDGNVISTALYSVTLDDDEGGTLTFGTAPEASDYSEIYVLSEPELTQPSDFDNAGPSFNPAALTRAIDRAAIRDLKLNRDIGRALKLPFGEVAVTFPGVAERANKYISFLPNGDVLMSSGTGADSGLREDIASSTGGAMVGLDDGLTSQGLFTIMKATRRPAMDGIFSSGSDQLAALKAFVADSAANGQTIEWGPIDLALNAVTIGANGFRGLAIPSNSRWVFHPESIFRAIPNDSDSYTIFNLINAQNVVIEGGGARLIGDRDAHTGVTGEFGQGFRIQGSNDIVVRDLHISDCWGDGWYIGSTPEQAWCERIYLENISATNCRRNGIAIISVKGLRCIDGRFIDTNGTAPQWGIDIEPNFATDFLEDIEFVRPFTKNSNSHGFGIYLNAMEGSTNPVDIRIIGHVDDGSDSGFAPGRAVNIPGLIEYIDAKLMNANGPAILLRGKGANGPRIKIVRPTLIDWNRNGSSSPNLSAAILNYAETTDTGTYALGNVDIIEPDLKLNSGSAVTAISSVDSRTTSPAPMRDVRIIRPLDLQGLNCTTSGVKRFTDTTRASVRTLGNASESIGLSQGASNYITATLTTARTYTIAATHSVGREMTFEIGGADGNQARFQFPTGETLHPDTLGVSNYVYSSTKGARLKVRKAWNTLNYDAETVGFTVGSTLTGGTSGATGTILRVLDAGTTGTLYLDNVVGTFQNDETITGSGGGSATANGTLGAEWFVVEKVGTWATA